MTVIGIGGCTALLLAAFGLRHSISSIVDRQFGGIFVYDAITAVDDEIADYDAIIDAVSENIKETMPALQKVCDVYSHSDTSVEVYLVVPQELDKLDNFIKMKERKSGKRITISENSVIINEKLAELLNVKKGDTIFFNHGYDLVITDIIENYTYNYVYMAESSYKKAGFENDVKNNIIYMNMNDPSKEQEFSEALIVRDDVLAVSFASHGGDKFRDLVSSLTAIVIIKTKFIIALYYPKVKKWEYIHGIFVLRIIRLIF